MVPLVVTAWVLPSARIIDDDEEMLLKEERRRSYWLSELMLESMTQEVESEVARQPTLPDG